MTSAELLLDAFGRIRDEVHEVLGDLTSDQLAARLDGEANSIAWLIWHLTRVQDHHLAELTGDAQVWRAGGWVERFGLDLPADATGYGQSAAEVAAVKVDGPDLLAGYHDAVSEAMRGYVGGLVDADLDRVVDTRWDPPVTLGVRLISIVADDLQHVGQAAFVRGVVLRRA